MIDVLINITGSVANIPDCLVGNAHEHNVRQLVFTTDWAEDAVGYAGTPLTKTIVFVTPSGVSLIPKQIVANKISLSSDVLDGAGNLKFSVYGKILDELVHNASGTLIVGAALSDLGGTTPAVYEDITTQAISATSTALAAAGNADVARQAALSSANVANTAAANADATQAIKLTQAQYDAIVPDSAKIYFIVG